MYYFIITTCINDIVVILNRKTQFQFPLLEGEQLHGDFELTFQLRQFIANIAL